MQRIAKLHYWMSELAMRECHAVREQSRTEDDPDKRDRLLDEVDYLWELSSQAMNNAEKYLGKGEPAQQAFDVSMKALCSQNRTPLLTEWEKKNCFHWKVVQHAQPTGHDDFLFAVSDFND